MLPFMGEVEHNHRSVQDYVVKSTSCEDTQHSEEHGTCTQTAQAEILAPQQCDSRQVT